MKKLVKRLCVLSVALVMLFAITSCAEVENGSKIQRMTMEIEFLDASGEVVDTQAVEIKLYLNFAPKTSEHFMKLCEEGYYDNTVISHVNNSWCEFGGYVEGESTPLSKKAYEGEALQGEFKRNGWVGNQLRPTAGALIMKRDYNTKDGVSRYNSAKATVAVTFVSTTHFDYEEYCIFGVIENGDSTLEDGQDSSGANLSELSSLAKFSTITEYITDENDTKTYYNEKEDKYYTVTTIDGSTLYYNGLEIVASNEITGEELETLKERLIDEENDFLSIPYTTIRIKSIVKKA